MAIHKYRIDFYFLNEKVPVQQWLELDADRFDLNQVCPKTGHKGVWIDPIEEINNALRLVITDEGQVMPKEVVEATDKFYKEMTNEDSLQGTSE